MTTQWFQSITMQAAADLSTSQGLIVDINSGTQKFKAVLAHFAQGWGVLGNHPSSGFAATVIAEGFPYVRAGEPIQAGQLFTANSDSYAVPASVDASKWPGNMLQIVGVMLQSVSSGQLALCHLERFVTVNSAGMSMPNSFGLV